ncbi:MAG TPA: hypothetical protein VNE00_22200 [Paraburkholderia sp.]|jgi:hypothetical protein|nr:hypothetical protein [Paraburkholderia sp.]
MPRATLVYQYPKSSVTLDQVQQMQQSKLKFGASSCVLTSDDQFWILTTVWTSPD